jgi:HlyD family secretion protein
MKARPIVILIAGLAAAGGAIWVFDLPQRFGWVEQRAVGLTLYGNVDIRQVRLGFRVSGRVAQVLVDEGDPVKAGTVLARLDDGPLKDQMLAAKANVESLKASLAKLEAGPRVAEISQAKAQLAEHEAQLVNAEMNFQRAARLQTSAVYSEASLDAARADRDMALARRDSAREALELLQEGSRPEDIAVARAQLRQGEAQLAAAQTAVADAELRAPSDGIVISRVFEPGAIVQTGESAIVISLVSPVYVRAFVGGPDLGRIREGMEVNVYSDSFPDTPYPAHIGFISSVAEFTPKTVETADLRTDLVYRLRVIVDDTHGTLRQGMPVTVTVADGTPTAKPTS